MNSSAAQSWQNLLFRKVCLDLEIDEEEEVGILKAQIEVVRGLRKKLTSDKFD